MFKDLIDEIGYDNARTLAIGMVVTLLIIVIMVAVPGRESYLRIT